MNYPPLTALRLIEQDLHRRLQRGEHALLDFADSFDAYLLTNGIYPMTWVELQREAWKAVPRTDDKGGVVIVHPNNQPLCVTATAKTPSDCDTAQSTATDRLHPA